MLNKEAKLNSGLFKDDVEMKAIRDGYGEGLVIAGGENKNIVALSADLRESTRCEEFAKRFPERFFEVGVAEQNLATIAAGLGISGKIPFVSSYAVFSPGRNWEQIRTTIAYNDANVKIAGHHAGISVGPDGATHQATEDIAIMRVMPNMKVFVPCDAIEAKKATEAAAHIMGPVYIRFAREKTPVVTTNDTPFTPAKAEVFWESTRPSVTIAACGTMVYQALLAARELEKEKIGAIVLNIHTIKPLDEATLLKYGKQTKAMVTAEEHQISGGLGGAIAELFAKHFPLPIEMVGIHDTFGESGNPDDLMKKYGLTTRDIVKAVKKVLKRKK
ncbi:MAG: transketolase C-terminal domain-containing protein [Candidatus Jorgensenbacteria bacterium]|nr:transketolase C-terminal domain-containing protein [Candidatus Jorgensenbacteria bacterium]